MAKKTYRQLDVWQRAIETAQAVYALSSLLPESEKYGLTSQLQRAGVSIPANIAEGYGRLHRGDYIHHLSMARGSLFELETLLTLTVKLKLISRSDALPAWSFTQDVCKMQTALIASLNIDPPKGPRLSS